MRRRAGLAALALLLLLGSQAGRAEQAEGKAVPPGAVVVAVAKGSPLQRLTLEALRRAFLGLPVERDGVRVLPLVNRSDPLLYEIFLQKVVFLSARSYTRLLLSRTLRTGAPRPPEYTDVAALREALAARPGAVAVLWARDVHADPRLRVLQVLWSGEEAP